MFTGKNTTHILADVIKAEPGWSGLPVNLHPRLRLLLERCLEKESKDRCHDIADARVDIQRVLADPNGVLVQPVPQVIQVAPQSKLPWVAAIVLAVVAGLAGWYLRLPEPSPVIRFYHVLPEGQQFTRPGRPVVAVSPDGSRMVYVANQQLYVKAMDTLESIPIPGTNEDPSAPFFSPDGQWVGFWSGADVQLKKIAISGGAPVTLCDAARPRGVPVWGADDTIVWGQGEGIMRVSANGGTPEVLIAGPNLSSPQILPDGESVLFHVGTALEGQVVVQSLGSVEQTVLLPGVSPKYVSSGHVIYGVDDVLFAVPFDVGTLEVTGGPVPLVEDVRAGLQYAFSDSGSLVYVPAGGLAAEVTVWVDRNGLAEPIETIPTGNYGNPRLSPDGGRLLTVADGDLWIYDIASGRRSAITTDGMTSDFYFAWSPDGSQVAYASSRSGNFEVWIQPADGSGEPEQVTQLGGNVEVDSWSPNGDVLAVHHHGLDFAPADIFMIPLDEAESMPQPFLATEFSEHQTQFSPDGRFVAYVSGRTGEFEVYIRPYPGPGAPVTASVDGGVEPVWGRNGELFYRHPMTHAMMRVVASTEPTLTVGVPELLFEGQGYAGYAGSAGPSARYDVTEDGQRFLMKQAADTETSGPAQSQINIVLNWFEELKERVPVP